MNKLSPFVLVVTTILAFLTLSFSNPVPIDSPEDLILPRQAGGNARLRITRPKSFGPPYIYGYLEIGVQGDALWNKTANYPGFPIALNPGPWWGKVWRRATGERGYLEPLQCDEGHYQFKWGKVIPQLEGVLSSNFTKQGRDCGAMCGGIDFRYDSSMGTPSTFFAVPHPTVKNVWLIQYTSDVNKYPPPAEAWIVILWWEPLIT